MKRLICATPFDESPDPALEKTPEEFTELEPTLESVIDLADEATDMARRQNDAQIQNTGQPGRRIGTGKRPLGLGEGDGGGVARDQRWYVSFGQGTSVEEYARQLDFFKIELGSLQPGGRLVYASNLAESIPSTRSVTTGSDEKRLYFTWQGGGRRAADVELLQKTGIDPGTSLLFHFYPPAVEQQLAQLERSYRNRNPKEIRRTYFAVQSTPQGYAFVVTRQIDLR